MTYDLIELEIPLAEPISLAEAKAYIQIDAGYSGNDDVIQTAISTARIRLEQYLNVGLINRNVEVQWNGREISLPLYPNGAIQSIKINEETAPLEPSLYTVSRGRSKKILINSKACFGTGNWFYSSLNDYVEFTPTQSEIIDNDIYTCIYNTGYEVLPLGLKQAILAETSYIFNLHGSPVTDLISPNSKLLANGYSHNLIL